jgi:phytanoyl-CoA hydroxylase
MTIALNTYPDTGYLLVKGLLSKEEAAELRDGAHRVLRRAHARDDAAWGSAQKVLDGEVRPKLQGLHDIQFYDAAFSRILVDDRFTSVAAAVIGSDNVQLHHTKAFVKPPEQGAPFPLHQDYPFFPHTSHRVAAAIFHLDDAPERKGCVRVVPGSHKRGPLDHNPEGNYHLPVEDWPLDAAIPIEAEAGDVLFFSYLTVHGSGVNRSDEVRTTWLVQFRDPADPPTTDRHTQSRGQGMMLRGTGD